MLQHRQHLYDYQAPLDFTGWKPAPLDPRPGDIHGHFSAPGVFHRFIRNPDGSETDISGASNWTLDSLGQRYVALIVGKPVLGYIWEGTTPPSKAAQDHLNGLGVYFNRYDYVPFGHPGDPPTDLAELRANWSYRWGGLKWQLVNAPDPSLA